MTHEEAKQAYIDMNPVWHNGIEYAYIKARKIQRDEKGKHVMFLELMDKCNHSITTARVERVSLEPPKSDRKDGEQDDCN